MSVARGSVPHDGTVARETASRDPRAYDQAATRIILRPVASPLTLAFLALAVGTFILAGLQLSWIPITESTDIGLALIVFVFPLQAVSSIFGFLARDSIAGTGTGLLSATWLAIGVLTFTGKPGQTSGALGLLLIGAAATLLVPATVGAASKPLASLVITGVALRFFLTGAYEMSSASGWKYAAAAEGLLLAAPRPLRRAGVRARGQPAAHRPAHAAARNGAQSHRRERGRRTRWTAPGSGRA